MPSERNDARTPTDRCPECDRTVPAGASFCPDCGADLDGPADPAYCAECGERFDDDDRFCSNCGAPRSSGGSAASARPSRAPERTDDAGSPPSRSASSPGESERAFRRRVQDHLDAGWDIERDDGDRVVLVDRGIGSVGVHVLLFIFTSGIGNLLYGWWHYSKLAERRRLVRGDDTAARAPSRTEGGGRTELLSAYLLSALLLLIGGWIGFVAVESGSPPVALIGLAFALLGAYGAPPVDRRLDRRHGITEFGRLKTVDHRTVRPPESVDEACVVCGEAFDRGLVRRRRDETVVAGVPVRTHSMRYNHYCADCARSELFGDEVDAPSLGSLASESSGVDGEVSDGDGGVGGPTDAADASNDGATDGEPTDETATDSVRETADSTE
ncbi:zinc ribbon domain-containing protein [Halorubrum sp. GN11_10-6_MGM]|uniref:zinc ribbon domain-containing protein n=1 Tax=Halorubrum sp. GN11_10-6_MGM TaxID=2518112 RepID=UPI0010F662D1|nr:zinc ribbon domain-containing protein [Halorubrum sp. GN11_10-6_MGM]TKX73823.1 zinc ribbon domain-containing protein [Halorubrum sp. GN11_10-6_MGM]